MWSNFVGSSLFYLIAGIIVIFSFMAVTLKNIFHSALSLIVALLGVAAVYIYLNAEFLALLQILIYVGAIMTLIIFGIMLTLKISDKTLQQHNKQQLLSFLISGALAALLISIFTRFKVSEVTSAATPSLAQIGKELLSKYALPFEIISIILLAALIGAVVISSKD